MTPPDADGMTLLGKVLAAGTGVAAAMVYPVLKARSWVEKRLETKAEKSSVDKCIEHIEKLYVNAERDRQTTRDLHDKAMQTFTASHQEILRMLVQHANGAK